MDYAYEVIFCIVNAGFTDVVMDAARSFGARGGTVIHARGTANREAEERFNITIQPEKEIVMILVERDIRDDILHALYKAVGLQTEGHGIAFCMPVDDVVGLSSKNVAQESADEKSESESKPSAAKPENNSAK